MCFCLNLVVLQLANQLEINESLRNKDNDNNNNNNNIGVEIQQQNLPPTTDDNLLPITKLTKIMERALPQDAQISDDAKEAMQLCVSEFARIIMSEANKRCKIERRMIVNSEDLIRAVKMLKFEHYAKPLFNFYQNYRSGSSSGQR
ncbi:nuclear transcription factor Y subunit B-3-like protein [Trifolium pratense]|uniref:Nuclear transcription factor Y subunit B-3-like protein n=1 Tax=Trifolium pratense TaxID=57577 RepID=A0A2K3N6X2_TRIPR|nr:nuclear transcription factor Y subunit B-3-like protein [Trifolium pratense]